MLTRVAEDAQRALQPVEQADGLLEEEQVQAAHDLLRELKKRVEEMRRNPPAMGTYALHLSEFKTVDGLMLPHKIETSLDGEPNEEWTIERYKVNPSVKADLWEKK